MADRRIRKIRSQALDLALSGADILFVCEMPGDPIGKGAVFMFGSEETPTAFLHIRRTLNELKHKLKDLGLELDYTITQMEKGASE